MPAASRDVVLELCTYHFSAVRALIFTYSLCVSDISFTYTGIPCCQQGVFCYINLYMGYFGDQNTN